MPVTLNDEKDEMDLLSETGLELKGGADEEVTYSDLKKYSEALNQVFKGRFWPELQRVKDLYEDDDGELPPAVQAKMDSMNDHMDQIEAQLKEKKRQYDQQDEMSEERKAYRAFLSHKQQDTYDIREQMKTLTTDEGDSGGYLVPQARATQLIAKARKTSPVRQYATVQQISQGDSFEQPVRDTEFSTVWSGNEGSDPGDTTTADFTLETIPTHTQKAKVPVTMQMLEDSQYDIEGFVEGEVVSDFSQAENTAFISGNGVNKPEGILEAADTNSGSITTINSGNASALTYGTGGDPGDGLLGLVYDIEENEYANNLRLMFNRKTTANIRGLTDDNNMPIYDPGNAEEGPTVEGLPFSYAADVPKVASNNLAMIVGDFRQYVIVDRIDIMMQRDATTNWPTVKFKFRKRVGGQVVVPEAFRILQISS